MKMTATIGIALVAAPALAVEGHYTGAGSEPGGYKWALDAKIEAAGRARYRVALSSTNEGCASLTEGTGTLQGRILILKGTCPLRISFSSRSMRVQEGRGCLDHGAMCTFDGLLTKAR